MYRVFIFLSFFRIIYMHMHRTICHCNNMYIRYEKLHSAINRKPIRNNAYPLIVWFFFFRIVHMYVFKYCRI